MRTLLKPLITCGLVIMVAVFLSPLMVSQFASGASNDEDENVNMGALLDMLLTPKAIEALEPQSQWSDRDIVIPDFSLYTPTPLLPIFSSVTGLPESADSVFYVLNSSLENAFGYLVYNDIEYNYWQSNDGAYLGPLEASEFPYIVDFPVNLIFFPDETLEMHTLRGLWGASSIYSIGQARRIYYDIASEAPVTFTSGLQFSTDEDENAVPDSIAAIIQDNVVWSGQSENRTTVGADLNFPDDVVVPGQAKETVRFIPRSGITVDMPITEAFTTVGLTEMQDRVLGMIQVANALSATADMQQPAAKSLLDALPGSLLLDDTFISLHYFKGDSTLQPLQEITPLAAILTIQGVATLEAANPIYERLALWRYPLSLDPETGHYLEPEDGEYSLVQAGDISLTDGVLSAEVSQDGLIIPLSTVLWLDTSFPYALAADSEKTQPLSLKGFFPTWMGANPESGVLPAEATLQYAVNIDGIDMGFRAAENDVDGFDAPYAISPIKTLQTPNDMYLWTPTDLTANENAAIQLTYHDPSNATFTVETPVRIESTALVSTTVTSTVATSPISAQISLSPEQSEIAIPAGAYPLEANRFFTSEIVEATLDADEGWGVVRWLQDDTQVSTAATYSFMPDSGDTTITAEVASYALSVSVAPSTEWGEVLLIPAPAASSPGYAPGTEVTIEASPIAGSTFNGWSGADASQLVIDPETPGLASIIMDSDKSIEAVFRQHAVLTTSVQPAGSGAITYSVDEEQATPIPDDGVLHLDIGSTITLFATPISSGFRFASWQIDGEAAGSDTSIVVVMDADKTVTATFENLVTLTLNDSPNGAIELVSPEPVPCGDKERSFCFPRDTEVVVRAVALSPEAYVLNSWQIGNVIVDGTAEGFGDDYTLTLTDDISLTADFRRRLRVDNVSVAAIPINKSIPLSLTGTFPTWMGANGKAVPGLTAEEAEATYEILIAETPASFFAPAGSPFTPEGEGITFLDEIDVESVNTAYIWSPEIMELPDELTEIPVTISDRTNPLNVFEVLLPKEAFITVVTLTISTLPESTSSVVLRTPDQGVLPGNDTDGLALAPGEYIAGDQVTLEAVPAYSLIRYQITTDTSSQEVTTPEYSLTIAMDTNVLALFDTEAYQLTIAESANGTIVADPISSPGWPAGWYEAEAEVALSATPNPGYRFVTWSHDLTGEIANPLTLTVDSNKQLGALFLSPDSVAINVINTDGGTVVLQPEGFVEETNPAVFIYANDTNVRLIGRPNAGYRFDSWRVTDTLSDRTIADNPLDLRVAQDYTVEPSFSPAYTLDLTVFPEDSGEIIVSPEEPAGGYERDTVVTLTAVPTEDSGYRFIQWTGASAGELIPNSTTDTITVVMDNNKQLEARFSKFFVASLEPEEAWIIGGIVAKITGEALQENTVVRFGNQEASVFDVAPSGQYAFVRVPPLASPGNDDIIRVPVEVNTDGVSSVYPPGFTYLQRTSTNNLYTTAFTANQAGIETPVFVGRIGGRDATITLPPLSEAPVYGIVRIALPGILATSRTGVAEVIPGTVVSGLYDVGIHLYRPRIGAADVPQFGVMSYRDATHELLIFERPYRPTDASLTMMYQPALMDIATKPDAGPNYTAIRNGISLWGIASNYDYLYNAESIEEVVPVYQSTLQNEEVFPINEPETAETDQIRALVATRFYGGDEDLPANCFTWRSTSVLPATNQKAIKITAINNMPVNGTGSGPVEGGTAITLTSPYGGVAWIQSIEFAGLSSSVGGKVAARDLVSVQGENEFLLEFKTPKSARPGMTNIIIRTRANPDQPIVLQNVFEYTRPPIRWWLLLLILIGLMLAVIGMATGF